MDTQHFFPDFKPNQVLTSTQLNQLRQYLDGQTRLSRVRLTGTGIVCGLYGNTENGESLKLTGGYGITSDGYIIETGDHIYLRYRNYVDPDTVDPENDEDDPYPEYDPWRTLAKPYQQIPILELISEETLNDPEFVEIEDNPTQVLSAEVLEDKVLVLYLEMLDDPLKSCIVTDCNNKGENVVLTVRALLIDKEYLDEAHLCDEKDDLIFFPRLITYLQSNGKNLSQLENSTQLNKGYKEIATMAAGEISDKVTLAYDQYKTILDLDPEYDEAISDLPDALNDVTGGAFNQYHFDFIRQLARAYNEFAEAVCPLVKQCMFSGVFPRHLMLRDFIIDGSGIGDSDKYRHHFVPSPVKNVLHEDLENIKKHFERIIRLAFNSEFAAAEELKITPGQTPQYKLGENAIPHYLKLGAVEKWWQPGDCCSLHPPLSYHKNSMELVPATIMPLDPKNHPLHLDPGKFGFYNIEGFIGNPMGDVISQIRELKLQFNLDFDVIGLSFGDPEGSGFYQGLEPMVEMLKEIGNLRKALESAILEGVQQNLEEIQQLLEQIAAKEASLLEFNNEWIEQRKALMANCNISHLQADYLQLRSEIICTYQRILQSLDSIPEIPPPQGGEGCVDFDQLEPETVYQEPEFPSGSALFTQNNIPVTIHDFYYAGGGSGFNWARVIPASADFGEGNIMWTNNVNLGFDFTQLGTIPNKVSFLYKNDGSNENIQVNDGERIISLIKNGEGTIAPDVNLQVNVISEDAGIYMAVLTGPVQNLKVGGQEFSIDQVCAEVEEASIPSYPMKVLNLRKKNLEVSISMLEKKQKETGSPEEKNNYTIRINKLKNEKSGLEKITRISGSVNVLMKDVMVNSYAGGLNKKLETNGFDRGFGPLAGRSNPMQDLAYGFYLAVLDLRAKIAMLMDILPKDVRGFNYLLYNNTVKEILEQIVRIRLFINHLLDLMMAATGTIAPLMRLMAGPLLSSLMRNIAQIMGLLNAYLKMRYNCFPAELATIYFHLEHLMNLHLANFGRFAQKHTGMEHYAGVPKGGTFILVGEKSGTNQLVRADFALEGKTECCCEIDPDDICLPPIARIDDRVAEYEIDPQTGGVTGIDILLDVVKNDLNLNNPGTGFELNLKSEASRMGALLDIVDNDEGHKVIRYNLQEPYTGIDEFAYAITDNNEKCQLSDTGKVILLVREKAGTPFYAGGDIAVTHQFEPVIVDVALNDVLSPQMLDSPYTLTASSPTPAGNTLEVVTIENRRQALRFIPEGEFTGRDQFLYTIEFANTRASGMVTALVIPCCEGQGNAPARIIGSVYERTPEGLEGGLSGGLATLILNGNNVKTTTIHKSQYTFRNVAPGTYDLMLGRWNPDTGEPTHETKTINNVVVNEGQTVTLDKVVLDRLAGGDGGMFVHPEIIVILNPLTENLVNTSGIERAEAESLITSTFAPRMASRVEIFNEVKSGGRIPDEQLLEKTGELVSGKLLAEGRSAMKAYKQTLKKLISKHGSASGDEKTAYRALIDATVTSMFDEVALSEITELSRGREKHLLDITGQLEEAGISLNSIRTKWKSGALKNELNVQVVTKMNKILS